MVLPNAGINQNPPGTESSAAIAYSTPAQGPGVLVVTDNASAGTSVLGWNASPASPTFPTLSWINHQENSNCNDQLFQSPLCPNGHGLPPLLGDGNVYASSGSDTTILATGRPSQLALVTLGNSTGNAVVDVVMAISNNLGNSFGNVFPISDNTSNATISGCGQSTTPPSPNLDQPKVVMEGTTTHAAWVYWAAHDISFGTCYWHPFARKVWFDGGGVPHASGIFDLDSPRIGLADATNSGNIQVICTGSNLDNCAGGVEQLVMVWPARNSSRSGSWPKGECRNNTMSANTVDVIWRWAVRNVSNNSWYHSVDFLTEDILSPACVIPGADGHPNGNQRLIPVMAQENNPFYMAHVFLSMSKYFNNTGISLDLRGTRIQHAQINLANGASASAFEELSPVTSIAGCQQPTCTCTSVHSNDECFVEQFAASAANNTAAATMAVAWHDTRLSPHTWPDLPAVTSGGFGTSPPPLQNYPQTFLFDAPQGRHSGAFGIIGSWIADEQLASGANVPSPFLGVNGNTPWGDYEGMAVDVVTNSFYPVWADERQLSFGACPTPASLCNSILNTTQWKP